MLMKRRSYDLIADINITPFTDVVLVLLIIFMVAAPLWIFGIRLDLPVAKQEADTAAKENPVVSLYIRADGTILLDGSPYSADRVRPVLENLMKITPESLVAIGAEQGVVYEAVVHAIDTARDAGVSKYVLIK